MLAWLPACSRKRMSARVLRTTTSFFDVTPLGRVLNRFKDMTSIDTQVLIRHLDCDDSWLHVLHPGQHNCNYAWRHHHHHYPHDLLFHKAPSFTAIQVSRSSASRAFQKRLFSVASQKRLQVTPLEPLGRRKGLKSTIGGCSTNTTRQASPCTIYQYGCRYALVDRRVRNDVHCNCSDLVEGYCSPGDSGHSNYVESRNSSMMQHMINLIANTEVVLNAVERINFTATLCRLKV